MEARDIVLDRDLLDVLNAIDAVREQALNLLTQQEQTLRAYQDGNTEVETEALRSASKQQSRLLGQASQLRGVYRRAVLSTRATKESTAKARIELDQLHLQLQNLAYEKSHLINEIDSRENYAHVYTNLPLISPAEYLQTFPDQAILSEHELMIARIDHEHAERQSLEERRQALLKRKQSLIAENNRRKEDLANLDKDLEKFIEAADPIIKTFEKEY